MDDTGYARITDFGLATVTKNLDSVRSASDYQGQAARWTAPEILKDNGAFTTAVDVFSFAMVMIEVRYELFSLSFGSLSPRITTGIYRRSSVQ